MNDTNSKLSDTMNVNQYGSQYFGGVWFYHKDEISRLVQGNRERNLWAGMILLLRIDCVYQILWFLLLSLSFTG